MKRFKSPPQIESLSELGWRRVENSLFQQLALESRADQTEASAGPIRRRAVWPWVAAAAVAAAAAIVLSVLPERRGGGEARISRIEANEAPSHVTVGDAQLEVDSFSAIQVVSDGDRTDVMLEEGTVTCQVAPRKGRPPFVVHAGSVRVEVVGTVFAVSRSGGATRVDVFEGVVHVVSGSERVAVGAGSSWPANQITVDELEADEDGDHVVVKRRRSRPAGKRARRSSPDKPVVVDELPGPSDRELYETAARLEAADPKASIAIYRRLAEGNGPWAANALFAQGRLELDRGRIDSARSLLERYVERFPDGANAGDARRLVEDLDSGR